MEENTYPRSYLNAPWDKPPVWWSVWKDNG